MLKKKIPESISQDACGCSKPAVCAKVRVKRVSEWVDEDAVCGRVVIGGKYVHT